MLTWFAVGFAVLVVFLLYGLLMWAVVQDDDALDEMEQRKLNSIRERERSGHRGRNGNRREG